MLGPPNKTLQTREKKDRVTGGQQGYQIAFFEYIDVLKRKLGPDVFRAIDSAMISSSC